MTPSQLTTRVSPSAFSGAAVSSASSSCSAPSSAHCPTVVNTCWIAVRDGDSGSISPKLSSTSAGTRRAPRNAVTRSSSGTMHRPDIPQRSSIGTRLGPPRSAWYSRRGITTLPHRVIHSLSTTCLKRYTRPSATNCVVGDLTRLRQSLKTRPTDVVQPGPQLFYRLTKRGRSPWFGLHAMLPPEDIFLQLRHTSAQILRIFHPGPPSGFGRMSLHPKYIRARSWGPTSMKKCVNQNPHFFFLADPLRTPLFPEKGPQACSYRSVQENSVACRTCPDTARRKSTELLHVTWSAMPDLPHLCIHIQS